MVMENCNRLSEVDNVIQQNTVAAVYLWADFHEACSEGGQMDQIIGVLSNKYASVKFVKVNAEIEEISSWAEKFNVTVVPAILVFSGQKKASLIEGVKPAEITKALDAALSANTNGSSKSDTELTVQEKIRKDLEKEPLIRKIKDLINSSKIMVFMKGVPSDPKCKFSRELMEILKEEKVEFGSFNILDGNDIREELKIFSNWKTYPQVYVNGKLLGGLDSIKDLKSKGNLKENLMKAEAFVSKEVATKTTGTNEHLKELINKDKVMLFMKGTPDAPRCGFSQKMVGILNENGIKFSSFDILEDQNVRENLKKFSNWPTYPQLYIKGELVGGLDIVQELADEGDLKSELGLNEKSLEERLKELINSSKVMVFIKGSPDAPRCGFSRQMVEILTEENCSFGHFDILTDEEIRQGLKTFSNWPTYPQLYVNGQLLGGLDIVKEMKEDGELADALK